MTVKQERRDKLIKIEHYEDAFWKHAIRGMRHPLESYSRIDSVFEGDLRLGVQDKGLMQRLITGGTEHRKFMRQIPVVMDITAPLYFYKEFDTYKVGTTANSTSTMHTITKKPITREMFAYDEESMISVEHAELSAQRIEELRLAYLTLKAEKKYEEAKQIWRVLIQQLPSSFKQTRMWTANYEVLFNMIQQRSEHKLVEWHIWIDEVLRVMSCPELMEQTGITLNQATSNLTRKWSNMNLQEREKIADFLGGME